MLLLLIITVVKLARVFALIAPPVIDQEPVLECIRRIERQFKEEVIYAYDKTNEFTESIAGLFAGKQTYYMDISEEFNPNDLYNVAFHAMHLINSNNLTSIGHYFERMYQNPKFGLNALIFLIHLGDASEINDVVALATRLRIHRLVVLSGNNEIFASRAFVENCGKYAYAESLGDCAVCDLNWIWRIFKGSFTDFKGCEVRALAFKRPPFVLDVSDEEHPGIETMMAKEAALKYNFTIKFVAHNYTTHGYMFSDGRNFSDMIGGLYNDEADIMFGNFRRNSNYLKYFEVTRNYLQTEYSFYVPSSGRTPYLISIMRVFTFEVWMLILFSIVLVQPIFYTCAKLSNERVYSTYRKAAFLCYAIFLSKSAAKPKAALLRLVFVYWTLCSYMITSSYESMYLSHQVKPTYDAEINTIEELIDSNLKFGGGMLSREIFGVHGGNPLYAKIYDEWINCMPIIAAVDRAAFQRDFAGMENSLSVNYNMRAYVGYRNRLKVHQMPRTIVGQYWMVINRGFPLKKQLDEAIKGFDECGFIVKWERDEIPMLPPIVETYYSATTLKKVMLPVQILICGLTFAFSVFIIEIYCGRQH